MELNCCVFTMCQGLSPISLHPVPTLYHKGNQFKLARKGIEVKVVKGYTQDLTVPTVPTKPVLLMSPCPSLGFYFLKEVWLTISRFILYFLLLA